MKSIKLMTVPVVALCAVGTMGCSFAKRSPEMYREDTRALLETKSGELQACYDSYLKSDKSASGNVTVFFVVQKETGKITRAEVKDANAPQALQDCVTSSLVGLTLDPPDADDGHATFTYEFHVQEAATSKVEPKESGFTAG
jgi:hypothetical protein